jgi:hypothetical protein
MIQRKMGGRPAPKGRLPDIMRTAPRKFFRIKFTRK